MKAQPISVDLLRIDRDTQSRLAINDETVDDYADLIRESNGDWPLGPLDVFHDGNDYMVADGFHRTLAAQRAKRASIPCNVHKGTATDARIFGMTANDRHGLRMSRADKRACVEWLLDNLKCPQAEIAAKAGVSHRLVKYIVAERKAEKGQFALSVSQDSQTGEDDSKGTTPQEPGPRPPRKGTDKPEDRCPNCAGTRWTEDDDGWSCAKCHHPHGEPADEVDEDRVSIQRSKTVKTVEALMRAFDDLHLLDPQTHQHAEAIAACKILLKTAREWK